MAQASRAMFIQNYYAKQVTLDVDAFALFPVAQGAICRISFCGETAGADMQCGASRNWNIWLVSERRPAKNIRTHSPFTIVRLIRSMVDR